MMDILYGMGAHEVERKQWGYRDASEYDGTSKQFRTQCKTFKVLVWLELAAVTTIAATRGFRRLFGSKHMRETSNACVHFRFPRGIKGPETSWIRPCFLRVRVNG